MGVRVGVGAGIGVGVAVGEAIGVGVGNAISLNVGFECCFTTGVAFFFLDFRFFLIKLACSSNHALVSE